MHSRTHRGRGRKPRRPMLPATAWVALFFLCLLAVPWLRDGAPVRWGLDLSGGARVVYRPDWSSVETPATDVASIGVASTDDARAAMLTAAKDTLGSRLARSLGAVPDVAVRGDQRIVVTIPGTDDQRRVLDLVGETYRLTFRLATPDGAETLRYRGQDVPLGPIAFTGETLDARHLRVTAPQPASMAPGSLELRMPSAEVAFRFQPPHDDDFETFTRTHVGRDLAILIDDEIEWLGRIESAIAGEGTLAGGYTVAEAQEVANLLRAGTLPIRLVVEDLESVGPSLGQALRQLGGRALGFGIVSVLALVWIAYRHRRILLVAGIESLVCLLATMAGLVAILGLTVDLAAIAGLVLSVGMGLDAIILVFESMARRQSKARQGAEDEPTLSFPQQVRRAYGFAREGGALLHANATSLIVVGLLAGNERLGSFAVFIAIGILASLITVLATRHRLLQSRSLRHGSPRHPRDTDDTRRDLLGPLREARPRLFRFRHLYASLVAIVLVGFAVFSLTDVSPFGASGGLRLGADFSPGTQIVFESPDAAAADATLDALASRFPDTWNRHQRMGQTTEHGGGRHLLTLGTTLAIESAPDTLDAADVHQLIQDAGSVPEGLHAIDARVAGRRLQSGLAVLGFGFVSLGIYLVALQPMIDRLLGVVRARQPLRARSLIFLGIVVAVVIDVALALATLGFAGIDIDLPVVAALLAIIGYSVNDSVVLANRIARTDRVTPDPTAREGTGVDRATARSIVEDAIDRILSRTVLTSVSTLVPAIGILALGLEPLRAFAWVIVIGVAAGTLSSMFVVGGFATRALQVRA